MILSGVHSVGRKHSADQVALVRAELVSILSSESFSSSKRCQDFLRFVVEHALEGDVETLTERSLGVELFGRAADYETATDSIVRVRANDVRRRLGQYYARGRPEPSVRIDLVAGGYVPEFHWRTMHEEITPEPSVAGSGNSLAPRAPELPARPLEDRAPTAPRRPSSVRTRAAFGMALLLLAAVVFTIETRPYQSNFDRFWNPVLEAAAVPIVSLPTTDTFQLPLSSAQTFEQLRWGKGGKLDPGDLMALHDWHVSLPVLQATLSVALALNRQGRSALVRVGTDLRRDEVRGHPVIAIGSFSNPWTEQNVAGLRFTFDRGASDREAPRIRDSADAKKSWSLPHIFPEPQSKDYAIVTRTFDPATREPFVSLAGLHSFGNQTAGEFVAQESSWDEVARRAPRGWEKMNL